MGHPTPPPDGVEPVAERQPWTSDPTEGDRPVAGWLRLRILMGGAVAVITVMVLLDFILVFVLPLPPEVASLSRGDVLLFGPAAFLALILVVLIELRPVARAGNTLRLGLRLPVVERERALRTALSFPVVLPGVVLAVGTAGNVVSFGLDVLGRTPWLWYAMHTTLVTQCIIIAAGFPMFVFARWTLRPFVLRVADGAKYPTRSIGLRGRVALMVATLVALIAVPTSSLLSLQLHQRSVEQREQTMQDVTRLLGEQASQMGLHSFAQYVQAIAGDERAVAFVVDARGEILPTRVAATVQRAGLPPPAPGRMQVFRPRPQRHLAVLPVTLSGGEHVWVGMAFVPHPQSPTRRPLVLLTLAVLLFGAWFALLLGAGVAREMRSVSQRIRALAEGKPLDRLPGDVGSMAEIGDAIDSINLLLSAAVRLKLRQFVASEESQESARSKTELLANMSHDLRAPLTAIIGFTDFLARGMSGPVNEGQRLLTERIQSSAFTLQRAIGELLDLAKLDAGRLQLTRAWTPPAAVVSGAIEKFNQWESHATQPQVRIEVQPGLTPVHVDPERTSEALSHLLRLLHDANPGGDLFLKVMTRGEGRERGISFIVGDGKGAPLKPEGDEIFAELLQVGNRRQLRVGAHLAYRLIIRQRGKIVRIAAQEFGEGFRVGFPLALTGELPAL